LTAIAQLAVHLPTVQVTQVQFLVRSLLNTMSVMALEAIKFHLFFKSAFIYCLSSFIHTQEWEEHSWFFNMKDWEYTNIYQQWRFIHCKNSFKPSRLGWQACRILGGTHKLKFVTQRTYDQCLLAALGFCSFFFSQKCSLVCIAKQFYMLLLVWQHTLHTLCFDSV
jgi:hypothetical protein